jgi:serine protease DegQ
MRRLWLLFTQAVTVALGCLLVIQVLKPGWWATLAQPKNTAAPAVAIAPPAARAPAAVPAAPSLYSYHDAASRAAPAVVSIVTSKGARGRNAESDEWFRYFFGDRAPPKGQGGTQSGLGSGVIVSADGYLLTNNHVVAGADTVSVQLNDGRETEAKVVGTDPETDLAVLKIELNNLPVVSFGNAKALRVGDVVLAIGNPFNVGQTVTGGIVSALGRNRLGLSTFENFIQTDAAINPGNSGGALVDATGALVGINTAIFSRSGGNMGIGFAVPADTAQMVLASLVKEGKVTRGWIGVEPRDLNEEFIKTFSLPVSEGVLITSVVVGGPADQAGVRPGDVVVKVAAQPVANTVQLLAAVAALKPGEPTQLTLQRGATALDLTVTVALRPAQKARPQ